MESHSPIEVPPIRSLLPHACLFSLAALVSAVTALAVASDISPFSGNESEYLLAWYVVLLVLAWIELTLSSNGQKSLRFAGFLWRFLFLLPTAILVVFHDHSFSQWMSWASVGTWTIAGVVVARRHSQGWTRLLAVLATIWTISTTIIAITELGTLPLFHPQTLGISIVSIVLDVRALTGSAFFALVLGTAMVELAHSGIPSASPLSPARLSRPDKALPKGIRAILEPILILMGFFFQVAHSVVSALWRSGATLVMAFTALGVRFLVVLKRVLFGIELYKDVSRILLLFVLAYLGLSVITQLSSAAIEFLSSSQEGWHLLWDLCLWVVPLGGIVWVTALLLGRCDWWRKSFWDNAVLLSTVTALFWILMMLLISGAPLYAARKFGLANLPGYQAIGPFTLVLSVIALGGTFFVQIRNLANSHKLQ